MLRFAYFSQPIFAKAELEKQKGTMSSQLFIVNNAGTEKAKRQRKAGVLHLWCPEAESNHRHADFQSAALPTELSGQNCVTQNGAAYPSRTDDLLITSQLLYQLS